MENGEGVVCYDDDVGLIIGRMCYRVPLAATCLLQATLDEGHLVTDAEPTNDYIRQYDNNEVH